MLRASRDVMVGGSAGFLREQLGERNGKLGAGAVTACLLELGHGPLVRGLSAGLVGRSR